MSALEVAPLDDRKRILIVDDEVIIANTLVLIFSKEGYEAKAANSADQAIDLISEWAPDMAIVDVQLSDVNGVDLAVTLRQRLPRCEVHLFTGLNKLEGVLENARNAGHSFQVISKPIRPKEMLDMVAQSFQGDGKNHLTHT